jgi:uncharacterized protein YjbI with pentapeptide repeats
MVPATAGVQTPVVARTDVTAARQPPDEPRVPRHLDQVGDLELVDDAVVEGVRATRAVVPDGEATGVDVVGAHLDGLRLTATTLERLRLMDVVVEGCELSGASLVDANLVRVRFVRCRMSGVSLAGLRAREVRFVDCRMDGAELGMADLERCELVDCDLEGADLTAARLTGCGVLGSRLDRAQLSKATLTGVDLHGSTFEGLRGAEALRGATIGSDQVVAVALPLLAALGITVDDGDGAGAG